MSYVPSGAGRGHKICHRCKALCKSAQNNCAECGVYLKKRRVHRKFSNPKPHAANCRRGLALSSEAASTKATALTGADCMSHAEQREQQLPVSFLTLPAPASSLVATGLSRPLLVRDDSVSVSRAAYSRTRRALGPYMPPLLARDDSTRSTQSMSEYRRLEDAIQATVGRGDALNNHGSDFSEGCTTDHEDAEDEDYAMATFGAQDALFSVFAGPHAARFEDLPPWMPANSIDHDV